MADISLPIESVPDGSSLIVDIDERLKIAVFRVGQKVAAIDNRCPHAGGSLGAGPFDGTQVKCPLHAFRVNVWTGVGNAGKRVNTFQTSITDDTIIINVPEGH